LSSRLVLSLVVSSFLVSPALAQQACAPEKLKAAIDVYANEPFGARAWRKLTGLGDAGVAGESYAYTDYAVKEAWTALVKEIAPNSPVLVDPAYECRIGYAKDVLEQRVAKFGKQSDYVKQWLATQEAVFKACGGEVVAAPADTVVPPNLKPEELTLFKQDREYQLASIQFYSAPLNAVPTFKAIGASNSPHKAAAHYNVANLLANAKNVVEARKEAKSILADPQLSSVHGITKELLGYIANLEDTPQGWAEMIDETVATLSQPTSVLAGNPKAEAQLGKAMYDIGYAGVTDKKDDWWITNTLPQNPTLSKALADAARKHPMVQWMMAGQSVNKPYTLAPWALVGGKWNAWAASYVTRAEALNPQPLPPLAKSVLESLIVKTDDASRAALWTLTKDAASKTGASCGEAPETAAVTTLAMQAMRVSALSNRYDEIYADLPALKLDSTAALKDVLLPKLMEQILASGNVEEGRRMQNALLNDALLNSFTGDEVYRRDPYAHFMFWIAEDEAQALKAVSMMTAKLSPSVFNLLPAAKLRALADEPMFSTEQRALLKRAAWTRNYARGLNVSDVITKDMLAANPEIAAALDATGKDYPDMKKDRTWLLTILRNPRFGILVNSPDWTDALETKREKFDELDSYDANDKNWWCPLNVDRQLQAVRRSYDEAADVSDLDRDALKPVLEANAAAAAAKGREAVLKQHPWINVVDWKEISALSAAPSAPERLAKAAVKWAKASKGKDGAPEALALAVRATRYGCRWDGSVKAYSKPAQEMLKAKFPTTTWAAQTPYWFDCVDAVYDANYNKVQSCKPRTWPKQALPK
jgi:hypothetical protein